ncbi:MAG: hypothetical protein FWD15_06285 [Alphaproteobacteria bacterium]|nr:hypothetical protein [Alphaproteobacteria bacterium]
MRGTYTSAIAIAFALTCAPDSHAQRSQTRRAATERTAPAPKVAPDAAATANNHVAHAERALDAAEERREAALAEREELLAQMEALRQKQATDEALERARERLLHDEEMRRIAVYDQAAAQLERIKNNNGCKALPDTISTLDKLIKDTGWVKGLATTGVVAGVAGTGANLVGMAADKGWETREKGSGLVSATNKITHTANIVGTAASAGAMAASWGNAKKIEEVVNRINECQASLPSRIDTEEEVDELRPEVVDTRFNDYRNTIALLHEIKRTCTFDTNKLMQAIGASSWNTGLAGTGTVIGIGGIANTMGYNPIPHQKRQIEERKASEKNNAPTSLENDRERMVAERKDLDLTTEQGRWNYDRLGREIDTVDQKIKTSKDDNKGNIRTRGNITGVATNVATTITSAVVASSAGDIFSTLRQTKSNLEACTKSLAKSPNEMREFTFH